jgi:hypothetical protein
LSAIAISGPAMTNKTAKLFVKAECAAETASVLQEQVTLPYMLSTEAAATTQMIS